MGIGIDKDITITIKLQTKVVDGVVVGQGSCSLDAGWIIKHVKGIAERYTKIVAQEYREQKREEQKREEREERLRRPLTPDCIAECNECGVKVTYYYTQEGNEMECPECGKIIILQ